MEARSSNSTAPGSQLAALAILPNRALAQQFLQALAESHAFHITAEWTGYPPVSKLESQLRQRRPEVLLIDVSANLSQASRLIEATAGLAPPVPVIALDMSNQAEALLHCLRAGATEFLYVPFTPELQRQAADRVARMFPAGESSGARRGRLVVFSSAKPGSGASTLAAHTGFALHEVTGERIFLGFRPLERHRAFALQTGGNSLSRRCAARRGGQPPGCQPGYLGGARAAQGRRGSVAHSHGALHRKPGCVQAP